VPVRACLAGLLAFLASAARGEAPLDSLVVVQGEDAWVLEIPFAGEWRHAGDANPARIVVDLLHARSRLPRAPGVFAQAFERGPVAELRASQLDQDPAHPMVRLTLLLRGPLPYHAGRHAAGSRIAIARPRDARWGAPWRETVGRGAGETPQPSPMPPRLATAEEGRSSAAAPAGAPASGATERGSRSGEASLSVPPIADPADRLLLRGEPSEGDRAALELPAREDPALLEALLADTAFFSATPATGVSAETAAARALGEGQGALLEGDTTAALQALVRCEQFYPQTDGAAQARVLRRLMLRHAGRLVEADLGPAPPAAGPWPLLRAELFEALAATALARDDLTIAGEVLTAWRAADPAGGAWPAAALRLAEACADRSLAGEASRWAAAALQARPDLRARPKALLIMGAALAESGDAEAAAAWLAAAASAGEPSVRWRALALQADLLYGRNRFAEAQALYEQLGGEGVARVERDWARYRLGHCLMARGDPRGAAAAFAEVAGEAASVWAPSARVRLLDLTEVRDGAAR